MVEDRSHMMETMSSILYTSRNPPLLRAYRYNTGGLKHHQNFLGDP